ncbi:hypothetical protein Pelo_7143 [Pelomyxa schiedti]|nr:hypothetical protein Pelo_7143 [Pelomyxa schiedti]
MQPTISWTHCWKQNSTFVSISATIIIMNTLPEPIPVSFIINPPDHGDINLLQEVCPIILGTYDRFKLKSWKRKNLPPPQAQPQPQIQTAAALLPPGTAQPIHCIEVSYPFTSTWRQHSLSSTGEWVANFYTMEEYLLLTDEFTFNSGKTIY